MSNSYYKDEAIFSAGGVLVDENKKVVLLIFKETVDEWLIPKGRMEEGETIEQTAKREIFEETGYKNEVKKLFSIQIRPDVVDPTKSKVIFWFRSILTNDGRVEGTQEKSENFTGKWMTKEEALSSLKWDEDKKLIEKAFEE